MFAYTFDAGSDPMRLDLISEKWVEQGIVKLDGGIMTWMRGKQMARTGQPDKRKATSRPTTFEMKQKGSGVELLVLTRIRIDRCVMRGSINK